MNTVRFIPALFGGVALLTACGESQSSVNPATASSFTVPSHPVVQGCPLHHCIIVADGISPKGDGAILFFAQNANGDVRPVEQIEGRRTGLAYPAGIATDRLGDVFAANRDGDSVTVYDAGAKGNAAPIRIIAGKQTQLDEPAAVAVDADGKLFVANDENNSITEYAANADGDVAPIRTISGGNTMLSDPGGIALDRRSKIYVTNGMSITVYSSDAKGDAAPERTISGGLTELSWAQGIAVDGSGYTYVADWDNYAMDVFAPNANGDVAPVRRDTGGLYGPDGVAVDESGRAYVSNGCQDNPAFIVVYAADANNEYPVRQIEGQKTHLNCSTSIVVR